MIRILHIVSSLNIGAGMTNVIMNYYRFVDRSRIQFDFVYMYDAPNNYIDEIMKLGGKCFRLNVSRFGTFDEKKLDTILNENNYLAIHCHPIFASVLFYRAIKRHGIKNVIAHSHSSRYSEKFISYIRNYLICKFIDRFATGFMACSQDAATLFGNKIQRKTFILHNAIDCQKFKFSQKKRRAIREELKIEDDCIVLGHVGRFSKEKNHKFLIDLFDEYNKSNHNTKLMLVGDGVLFDEILEYAKRKSCYENIMFLGNRTDVDCVLSAMDIFLFPSLFEGFGMSLLEAQASGLNCVVSDNLPSEVCINDNVYQIDIGNFKDWLEMICLILCDRSCTRENFSNKIVEHGYDIHDVSEKLMEYYERLV